MTFMTELNSWFAPKDANTQSPPKAGDIAPRPAKLNIADNKRTIIAFLRHCGCPFAEKTFLRMRDAAKSHSDINFFAVSHSEEEHTQTWLKSLPNYGTEPSNLTVVTDFDRTAYAAYGLGASSWAHVLAPSALSNVFQLSKQEGISNRPTESGSRWQTSGTYGIGQDGKIKCGGPATRSDDVPNFEQIVQLLGR